MVLNWIEGLVKNYFDIKRNCFNLILMMKMLNGKYKYQICKPAYIISNSFTKCLSIKSSKTQNTSLPHFVAYFWRHIVHQIAKVNDIYIMLLVCNEMVQIILRNRSVALLPATDQRNNEYLIMNQLKKLSLN